MGPPLVAVQWQPRERTTGLTFPPCGSWFCTSRSTSSRLVCFGGLAVSPPPRRRSSDGDMPLRSDDAERLVQRDREDPGVDMSRQLPSRDDRANAPLGSRCSICINGE